MRTIKFTKQFKRDFKPESKSSHHKKFLGSTFPTLINSLALDESLADRYRDHSLSGEWKDHRDFHIKPDLVLIYRKPDKKHWNSLEWVLIASLVFDVLNKMRLYLL